MSSHPIVTAEELACLLAAPVAAQQPAAQQLDTAESRLANAGAALWLVKGLMVYLALQVFGAVALPLAYLVARGVLEGLCAVAFWSTLRQQARRGITLGALLVGVTTLIMDLLLLLALPV